MTDQSDFDSESGDALRQKLSALADGKLSDDAVRQLCVAWRDDPQLRETWHAFSVIGDVMRSEDLAASIPRDEQFLSDLRARLSNEPVVLAPQPLPSTSESARHASLGPAGVRRAKGRAWAAPVAVAAGFVMAVGALVVVSQAPPPQATESAQLAPTAPLAVVAAASVPSASSPEFVANGEVIRDPQLDRYLFAHKQFSGSTVLGAPSGFLRNAAAEAPAR